MRGRLATLVGVLLRICAGSVTGYDNFAVPQGGPTTTTQAGTTTASITPSSLNLTTTLTKNVTGSSPSPSSAPQIQGWIAQLGSCATRQGDRNIIVASDDPYLVQLGGQAAAAQDCADACAQDDECNSFEMPFPPQNKVSCNFFAGVHIGDDVPGALCYFQAATAMTEGYSRYLTMQMRDSVDQQMRDVRYKLEPGPRGEVGPPGDSTTVKYVVDSEPGVRLEMCLLGSALFNLMFVAVLFTKLNDKFVKFVQEKGGKGAGDTAKKGKSAPSPEPVPEAVPEAVPKAVPKDVSEAVPEAVPEATGLAAFMPVFEGLNLESPVG